MSGKHQQKAYQAPEITVAFEARRCLHATECLNGLPEVFDASRRPWIQPDAAPADRGRDSAPFRELRPRPGRSGLSS